MTTISIERKLFLRIATAAETVSRGKVALNPDARKLRIGQIRATDSLVLLETATIEGDHFKSTLGVVEDSSDPEKNKGDRQVCDLKHLIKVLKTIDSKFVTLSISPDELRVNDMRVNTINDESVCEKKNREAIDDALQVHLSRPDHSDTKSGVLHFCGDSLRYALSLAAIASDSTSTRYALAGVAVAVTPGVYDQFDFVATDSRRLAVCPVKTQSACDEATLEDFLLKTVYSSETTEKGLAQLKKTPRHAIATMPLSFVNLVAKSKCGVTLEFSAKDGTTQFVTARTSEFSLSSRVIEGRFPRYYDIIPRAASCDYAVKVQAAVLLGSVSRAAVYTDSENRGVRIAWLQNEIRFGVYHGGGQVHRECVPVESVRFDTQQPLIGQYDPSFLIELLKKTGKDDVVTLSFQSSCNNNTVEQEIKNFGAAVQKNALMLSGERYQYVVMPFVIGD